MALFKKKDDYPKPVSEPQPVSPPSETDGAFDPADVFKHQHPETTTLPAPGYSIKSGSGYVPLETAPGTALEVAGQGAIQVDDGAIDRALRAKFHDLLQVLRRQCPRPDHDIHPSPKSRFTSEGYNLCLYHTEAWLRSRP